LNPLEFNDKDFSKIRELDSGDSLRRHSYNFKILEPSPTMELKENYSEDEFEQ
jgi:hypothetical protein